MQNKTLRMQHVRKDTISRINTMPQTSNRWRFWEINDFFKCPVVGMCLTYAEQQQVLKKADLPAKKASPFEMHEALVASAGNENPLSRRIDTLLNRKYGKKAADLLAFTENDFMARFKTMAASGELPAVLWAAAVHPNLSQFMKKEIFGEVHMTMHWSGEQRIKMTRKLSSAEAALADSQGRIKDVARKKRRLEKENARLIKSQVGLKVAFDAAENSKKRLEAMVSATDQPSRVAALEQENRILKDELDRLYRRIGIQNRRMASFKEKNQQLASQLAMKEKLSTRFRQEARSAISEMMALNRCDENCPSFDLCRKRILIVGGISRMESLYRDLIERSGGILEYHNGHMKNGTRLLESRLRRADLVLCPVSCNSHTACSVVKNLAKKHRKTVHMLANSSLQTISKAIWSGADCRHMVN
jgi:hypothetical protein